MAELLTLLGTVGLLVGLIAYNGFSWGYVVFKLYHWFLLPVFIGLPSLTYYQSIGLYIFLSLLRQHSLPSLKEELYKETHGARILFQLLAPWVALVCAWILKSFLSYPVNP